MGAVGRQAAGQLEDGALSGSPSPVRRAGGMHLTRASRGPASQSPLAKTLWLGPAVSGLPRPRRLRWSRWGSAVGLSRQGTPSSLELGASAAPSRRQPREGERARCQPSHRGAARVVCRWLRCVVAGLRLSIGLRGLIVVLLLVLLVDWSCQPTGCAVAANSPRHGPGDASPRSHVRLLRINRPPGHPRPDNKRRPVSASSPSGRPLRAPGSLHPRAQ